MMDPNIRKQLAQEELTPFHNELLQHCLGLVRLSRGKMGEKYSQWDHYDQVYRGEILPDEDDRKAEKRGEPQKMVVPLTYAQVQTFIAFCFGLFFQRERVFELEGRGAEDKGPAQIAEGLLERDLDHENFDAVLYQFLLDVARFGMGVIKTSWVHDTQMVEQEIQLPSLKVFGIFNLGGGVKTSTVPATRYMGNRILNISPYRFYPDVRLPLRRFQEGEFCASEDEMSWGQLKKLQYDGEIVGLAHIPKMTQTIFDARGNSRFSYVQPDKGNLASSGGQSRGPILVTEVQVRLIPSEFVIDGKPMGPEDYPVMYLVWIANDQRIIKCEPLNYAHGDFTYDVQEYSPDQHQLCNAGLAECVDQLQSVITWYINSHITSVRKTIQNQLVVDPSAINPVDLDNHSSILRLIPGKAVGGIDRYIKQLQVQDVTTGHTTDAQTLQALMMVVTGINENALGQYFSGRRSATEARNVAGAAAGRLKVVAQLIWKGALVPMAKKMVSNLREGLDEETFIRVIGQSEDPAMYYTFHNVTKQDLVGDYDFCYFDGTLPSERIFQAQTLQDLIALLIGNPQINVLLNYDLNALISEMLTLRGIRHPERFKSNGPNQQAQLLLQLAQQQQMNANAPGSVPAGTEGGAETNAPVAGE